MNPSLLPDFSSTLSTIVVTFLSLYPFWLPVLLGLILVENWMRYIREKFVAKQGSVLLEIKLPRDITKSPMAIEIILAALWQKGSSTLHETFLGGKIRPWFSFEIASLGGQVHFYVWCWPKFRSLVESQIYSQYPNVEIVEAEDYTKWAKHDPEQFPMWATYYKLSKNPVVPIKGYVDYGLDKASEKEEFKHDPLAALIEWMGSLQKGEQAWFQILFQAHREAGFLDGHIIPKKDWRKAAIKEIEEIAKEAPLKPKKEEDEGTYMGLPKMQQEIIAAIQRTVTKYAFDVGMRGLYISTKEANKISERVSGVIGAYRQFSSQEHYNEIRIGKFTDFDYPWEDFMRMRRSSRERSMLAAYKKRSYFQYPYKNYLQKPLIMSSEEIATLYHFPGAVVTTPNLQRIESRKSEAPTNLPV